MMCRLMGNKKYGLEMEDILLPHNVIYLIPVLWNIMALLFSQHIWMSTVEYDTEKGHSFIDTLCLNLMWRWKYTKKLTCITNVLMHSYYIIIKNVYVSHKSLLFVYIRPFIIYTFSIFRSILLNLFIARYTGGFYELWITWPCLIIEFL